MAFSNPIPSPVSSNIYINGLLWGKHWNDPANGTRLSVYIAGQQGNETFDFGGTPVTAHTVSQEIIAFQNAMQLIENVCNIVFIATSSQTDADLILGAVNNIDAEGGLGTSVPPGEDTGLTTSQQGSAIINFDSYFSADYSSLQPGGYDFTTFIHELGHAIGLKHPHDSGGGTRPNFPGVTSAFDDYGDFNLNQGVFTMMSYNDGWRTALTGPLDPFSTPSYGYEGTPMALDIAALQFLYGANTSFHSGNDLYTLSAINAPGTFYSCIWDAGGIDMIQNTTASNSIMDLRAATLQHAAGGGGFISFVNGINGGFTIANGVTIENATGGTAIDSITGNGVANILSGNAGNDRISGLGGADKINGGSGADILTGGGGADDFVYTAITDSANSQFDTVNDFVHSLDDIDVAAIDANGSAVGDAAFTFRGKSAFTGAGAEIRYFKNTTQNFTNIQVDIDGNKVADMTIRLTGTIDLSVEDFIL